MAKLSYRRCRIRKAALVAAAFASVVGGTWTAYGAEVGLIANSVLRTYNDYCDPTSFDQHYVGDGAWDETLSENYARVLFTRHGSDCEQFRLAEVVVHLRAVQLHARLPELQRTGRSNLNSIQAETIGMVIWMDDRLAHGCELQADSQRTYERLVDSIATLRAQAVESDALAFARGYLGVERFIRVLSGLPMEGGAAIPCSASGEHLGTIVSMATTNGVIAELDLAHRPRNPTLDAMESFKAIVALGPLEGWWRFSYDEWGCEDTDNQYRVAIGRWTRQDGEIVFGMGAPKVGLYDFGCELSNLVLEGDGIEFHAQCTGEEDETYEGKGNLLLTAEGEMRVLLPGWGEQISLTRCPVGAAAQ